MDSNYTAVQFGTEYQNGSNNTYTKCAVEPLDFYNTRVGRNYLYGEYKGVPFIINIDMQNVETVISFSIYVNNIWVTLQAPQHKDCPIDAVTEAIDSGYMYNFIKEQIMKPFVFRNVRPAVDQGEFTEKYNNYNFEDFEDDWDSVADQYEDFDDEELLIKIKETYFEETMYSLLEMVNGEDLTSIFKNIVHIYISCEDNELEDDTDSLYCSCFKFMTDLYKYHEGGVR